ncbi:MAG: acylphosphatase [Candidatus Heimdallarchaeota archaeon]|nr:acylphosphatase [Candidatus Heimdallarchaeota archaeon]MCK5158956.1 acylphosphatase [Candidatus Heimdallarchaeota archaeon]MCK5298460.1 acylphosphatase [Candidatus Heimdallarchaeota archaeon]
MSEDKYIRVEIVVKGLVQGVSFRVYTRRKASSLGLTGYVRNLSNGDVEVVAEGKRNQLLQLIKWLRKSGSPASNVTDVIIEWSEKLTNYTSFRVVF